MRSVELVLLIFCLSLLCIGLSGASIFFLPTSYATLAVTFVGGIWTPVVSGMLIIWFNTQIKDRQAKTELEFRSARQDILEVKNLVNGNYAKLLIEMEKLREDNTAQRNLLILESQHADALKAQIDGAPR